MRRVVAILGLVGLLAVGTGTTGAAAARAQASVTSIWALNLLPGTGGRDQGYVAWIKNDDGHLTGVGGLRGNCTGTLTGTDINGALHSTFNWLGTCLGEVVILSGTTSQGHASGAYFYNRGASGAWIATVVADSL